MGTVFFPNQSWQHFYQKTYQIEQIYYSFN